MKPSIRVAITGNPNSGKTTIFNALTGTRQHVGNYPGVTVEKKEGTFSFFGKEIQTTDLPGTYSLSCESIDERIARNVLITEKPDVIVSVVDASNLERNLYLTTQLMELGIPLVLVLNMSDRVKKLGITIDSSQLSQLLNVDVVPTVGNRGVGINDLKQAIVRSSIEAKTPKTNVFGHEITSAVEEFKELLPRDQEQPLNSYKPEWVALRLLEGDTEIEKEIHQRIGNGFSERAALLRERWREHWGDDPYAVMSARRYEYLGGVLRQTVREDYQPRRNISQIVDSVFTHRFFGIPIFLGFMYGVFYLTFTVGEAPMNWIEGGTKWLGAFVSGLWPEGSESLLRSLLVDGVIGGVGGVIIFVPNIVLLFLAIALLEDSGYMARAAFIIDRLMQKIGLHGKSFIPMLVGFGCSVPGIMATRTLENRSDRFTTILVLPLMSCGARLPIYLLIIPAFFPKMWQTEVLWIIYLVGILLAIGMAKLLRSTVFKGKRTPFVMELPPYHRPTLHSLLVHAWERTSLYLRKAGTIILAISILMWFLTAFPRQTGDDAAPTTASIAQNKSETASPTEKGLENVVSAQALEHSYAGRIGQALEPVMKPLGFDWQINTALLGSFAAKEVFVAQMGIVYAMGETDEESESLRSLLRKRYSPLVGLCIILFCLISAPCMATLAVTRRETGSWKWALAQFTGLTLLAYGVSLFVYQVGQHLGWGVS